MSEAVDTRVVEAKFDSAQFEKGVDRTVKKLDELKKSLNFDESGKSIAELSAKTQSAAEQASSSLEKLEYRVTSFVGMLKQKLLGGIADEIVGVFFKLKNSVEGFVRSLSSDQISVGMNKYEQMLTSVRTMVAAGDSEDAAYKAIETLGLYADQTSYSLDQMTSALSKMRAAGVGLGTGTKAVEGIANACAIAGVNATDASRAFYNLSQAYSSGTLKYTDYRSLELLNMTTENFKLKMLEAAVAAGTLEKKTEGVYKTVSKGDKKVTGGKEVTVKNLTDALRYNFMNTEAMNKLFGEQFFFDESEWKKIKAEFKELGKSEEEALAAAKERFGDVAVNAYFAAREARSFTDVMNTFRDVVSRGWAASFELVIGKLSEATKFFTDITESNFAEFIYSISEFRNAILSNWNDAGGRDSLIRALENIDKIIGKVLDKFAWFSDEEGDAFASKTLEIGLKLKDLTNRFERFTQKLDAWFTDARIDRMARIVKTLKELFTGTLATSFKIFTSILNAGLHVFDMGLTFIDNLLTKMKPVFEAFGKAFSKVIDPIMQVLKPEVNGPNGKEPNAAYVALQQALDNILLATQPLIDRLPKLLDILASIGAFFVDLAAGTAVANLQFIADILGLILELFGKESAQKASGAGILDQLAASVNSLKETCTNALAAVNGFFTSLVQDVRKILGLDAEVEGKAKEGGFFENLSNFFKTNTFIESIRTWFKALPGKIKGLFVKEGFSKQLYNQIATQFSPKAAEAYKNSFKGPLAKLWDGISSAFMEFIKSIPERMKKIWETILDLVLGKKTGTVTEIKNPETGETTYITDRIKEGFSKWFDDTIQNIENWIRTIPETAKNIWNTIIDFIFGKEVDVNTVDANGKATVVKTRVKDGFSLWLSNLVTDVKNWLTTDFQTYAKTIWNSVVKFIFGDWDVTEKYNSETQETEKVYTCVRKGLVQWVTGIPAKIKEWFDENKDNFKDKFLSVWSTVIGMFFGENADSDEVPKEQAESSEKATDNVKSGFLLWLESIVASVKEWFTEKSFIDRVKDAWNTILDFIFGKEAEVEEVNPDSGETTIVKTRVKEGFSLWLDNLIKEVPAWIADFKDKIKTLWSSFLGGIFGTNEEEQSTSADVSTAVNTEETKANLDAKEKDIVDIATEFAQNLGANVASVFSQIPVFIADKIEFGTELVDSLLEKMQKMLDDLNAPAKAEDIRKSIIGFTEAMKTGDTSKLDSPLAKKVVEIGTSIKNIITDRIPSILSDAWKIISSQSTELWNAIQEIFNIPSIDELGVKVSEIGNTIAEHIRAIPGYITSAVQSLKDLFTKKDYLQIAYPNRKILDLETAYENAIGGNIEGWSLWDTIKEIGISIKEAIVALGPDILDGINSVIKWISGKIDWVTDLFNTRDKNEDILDSVAKKIEAEGGTADIGLINALKNIGSTIQKLITETIPNFISAGISEVVHQVPKLIQKVLGGGELDQAANDVQEAVEGAIVNATPEISSEQASSGKESGLLNFGWLLDMFIPSAHADEAMTEGLSEYADNLDTAATKAEEAAEAEKKLVNRIDYIRELTKKRDEAFNEQYQIELANQGDYEKYSKDKNWLELKSTIEGYNKTIDALRDMKEEQIDLSKEDFKPNALDNVTGFLGGFADVIKNISSFAVDKLSTTVLIIAAIGWVLYLIRDMLTFTDEIESVGWTVKWAGLSAAFGGIVAILGYITYLASQSDTSKFNRVKKIFDDIGSFIERMTTMMTVIAGLSALKAGFSMVTSSKDAKSATGSKHPLLNNLVSSITNTFVELGVLSFGSDVIAGGLTNIFDGVLTAVQDIGASLESIMTYIEPAITRMSELNGKMDNALDAFQKFDKLLIAFKKVLTGEGFLGWGKGGEYDDAWLQLLYDYQKAMGVPDELNIENPGALLSKNSEDQLVSSIESRIAWLYHLTTLVGELGIALQSIEKVEKPTEAMKAAIEIIDSDESGFSDLLKHLYMKIDEFSSYIYTDWTPTEINSAGASMRMISDAINIFTGSIAGLGTDQVATLKQGLDIIQQLANMLDDKIGAQSTKFEQWFSGDNSIGSFGRAILTFGGNMESFFEHVKKINPDGTKTEILKQNTEVVLKTIRTMASASTSISRSGTKFDDLKDMFKDSETFADDMVKFISAFKEVPSEDINMPVITNILDVMFTISGVLSKYKEMNSDWKHQKERIDELRKVLMGDGEHGGFIDLISDFYTSLSALSDSMGVSSSDLENGFGDTLKTFNYIATLITRITDVASMISVLSENTFDTAFDNLSNFNWDGFLIAMRDAMNAGLGEEESFFEPVITPVLEISDDFITKASTMRSMLGFDAITQPDMGMYSFNNTSSQLAEQIVPDELKSIDSNVSAILSSVNDCKMGIQHFNSSLSRTSFVMYGKDFAYAVGPDIDEYLGRNGVYVARNEGTGS